jgi:hypothetical protein
VDETAAPRRAGAAGRGRSSGAAGDAIVVACQRHPWIASVALSMAVGIAATAAILGAERRATSHEVLAVLPLVTASFAAIGHIGRGARATADRLAPWFAANVVALAVSLVLANAGGWPAQVPETLALAMAVAVWPLASAALLPGSPPGDETPIAAAVFPATVVAFPTASALVLGRGNAYVIADAWLLATVLCVPLVPLAVHALVRSRMRTRLLLALSLAYGVAWERLHPGPRTQGLVPAVLAPAAALAVGLLIVAARRARSMTAVPLDHAVVEDFGGR